MAIKLHALIQVTTHPEGTLKLHDSIPPPTSPLVTLTLAKANTRRPSHRARLQPSRISTPSSLLLQLIAFRLMECVDLDVDVDLLAQRGESGRLMRGQGAPADGEGRTGRREMANFDPKMAESACSKSRKER